MSLCTPTRCGCSITSDTLSVVNFGDVINLEVASAANSYPTFNYLDAAERDSTLTAPVEGMEAWLRSTNQKTRYSGTAWRVVAQPRTVFTITPAMFTSLGSHVVIGNGTLTCFYSRSGDDVHYNGRLIFGTTTGLGLYVVIPGPVPIANSNRNIGAAGIYDVSTNIVHPVQVEVAPGNGMVFYRDNGTNVFTVNSTNPITTAVGDEMWWNVRYPAA